MRDHSLLVGCILAGLVAKIFWIHGQKMMTYSLLGAVVCCVFYLGMHSLQNTFHMHLFAEDAVNESLILEGNLCGRSTLFLLDTGYAGPPVISTSYLATTDNVHFSDLNRRYATIMDKLSRGVSELEQHRAVDELLKNRRCIAFTSGCTMRLMSIGDTQEAQADMVLCPPIMLQTKHMRHPTVPSGKLVNADVLVTNPLAGSIHILTCDYLQHSSPAYIDIERCALHLNLCRAQAYVVERGMQMQPYDVSGGAFVIVINLGGIDFRVTVDTGASGPVSLGKEAAKKITACRLMNMSLTQRGVNGESVCSDIITADMKFCGRVFPDVPVFLNSSAVEDVDGYIGMGVLRAFNIFIAPTGIGFCANALRVRSASEYQKVSASAPCKKSEVKCAT